MIYEEKNSLSKEVCNDMISWFDNKLISGKVGINYVNVSDEIRKTISFFTHRSIAFCLGTRLQLTYNQGNCNIK